MKIYTPSCPVCGESSDQVLVDRKWEFSIYRCGACTVDYADPMKSDPSDQRITMSYNRRFDLVGNYIGWYHREFLAQRIKPGGRLLELGCGTGDFVELARKKGYQAIGVDLDEQAVAAGRRYWKTNDISCQRAEDYFRSQNGKRFDIVCMFEVLEHLDDPNSVLKSIQEFLEPDAYIVLSTPNNASPFQTLYRKLTRIIDYPPHHLLRWNRRSLEVFLKSHDFEITHYSTCEPSVTDIVNDLYKMHTPSWVSTYNLNLLSSATSRALSPIDHIIRRFAEQGRSQMVIARNTPA